jgi:hypothetical protein
MVATAPAKLLSCVVNGGVVTMALQTERESFACLTYNGVRVKNANQFYENGVLTIQFQEV